MTNQVHEWIEQLSESFEGVERRVCVAVDDQRDWYAAMTMFRQMKGWTISHAEEVMGLAERHLSKIEPARALDWAKKRYLKLCLRLNMTYTARVMMITYGYRLMLVPDEVADALLSSSPAPGVTMTTHERRRLGIPGDQLSLPLPRPRQQKAKVRRAFARDRAISDEIAEALRSAA